MPGPLHEQAVDILYGRLTAALGGKLLATGRCNECPDEISIDLLKDVAEIKRNAVIGPVMPDLVLLDRRGRPLTFVEVVVSHSPGRNVHNYALEHGVQILEFDVVPDGESLPRTGRRRKATEEALAIKARFRELQQGQPRVDVHNLSCERPRCSGCGSPLPLRTVIILTKNCWNCERAMRVAVGSRDSRHLYPAQFNESELAFARAHGVTLEVRYSATVSESYLANVCRACDQMQGNWFLYQDPFHDSYHLFEAEQHGYDGPCDKCSERICNLHGDYFAYEAGGECPACVAEAELTSCREDERRECHYPATCDEQGCYFTRREEAREREAEERIEEAGKTEEEALASIEREVQPLRSLIKGCSTCGAPRKEFLFRGSQAFCTRCGAVQGPDHFRA
ncbi:MAG: hypothetical protein OXG61_08730 [Chloroflexi bacterium]|nr:hypothetical protein [Chloroflexota bacterium]